MPRLMAPARLAAARVCAMAGLIVSSCAAIADETAIGLVDPLAVSAPVVQPLLGNSLFNPAAVASYAQDVAEEIQQGETVAPDTRPFRPITQLSVDAALPAGVTPGQPGTEQPGFVPAPPLEFVDARLWGGWAESDFTWAPTGLCHRPLYFEEVNLERYGYTRAPLLQPAISGAHFFLTIPTLPYKMVVQPPRECVYTLGYYRAGSPAPWRWHCMDLAWDPLAVTVEGLLVTGLVFAIP